MFTSFYQATPTDLQWCRRFIQPNSFWQSWQRFTSASPSHRCSAVCFCRNSSASDFCQRASLSLLKVWMKKNLWIDFKKKFNLAPPTWRQVTTHQVGLTHSLNKHCTSESIKSSMRHLYHSFGKKANSCFGRDFWCKRTNNANICMSV